MIGQKVGIVGLAWACSVAGTACSSENTPQSLGDTSGPFPSGLVDGSAPRAQRTSEDASSDALATDATPSGNADAGVDAAHAVDAATGDGDRDAADAAAVAVSPGTDAAMAQPACDPTSTWSAPVVVGGLSFPTQAIVTMTSDETTVAWVLDAGQGMGSVFTADRATIDDPFGSATQVVAAGSVSANADAGVADAGAGTTYFAFDRVGLSADGLTLVAVSSDGLGMAEFTRTGTGEPFFPFPQPSKYAALVRPLMPGEVLGDPVLSPDGDDIVYSRYGQSQTVSVFEAFRSGAVAWGGGTPRESQPLQMSGGLRKLPMSFSADRLTLFVWDQATNAAYGVFRDSTMGDFTGIQSYGPRFSLQTNGACTRLYFVSPAGPGFALYQVTAM